MYKHHFGLTELPFSIAPNPRYLYLTHQHQEALAHLIYGIQGEGGIILLTGEVGTGKTTISRKLLEDIPENIEIAWIVNPRLSVEELLATICDELSISYPEGNSSIKIFTDLISAYLIAAHGQGRNVVLMIDEAQNLSPEVLEQLRLLTNLETNERKLLQIVLLGQPELKVMLERSDLRQLAQRITARYHLHPLNRQDCSEYIRHRLAVGGCELRIFTHRAIKLIHHFSGGTPRLINLFCDRALLGVYSQNGTTVKPAHVRQVYKEVQGESETPKRHFGLPITVACVLAGAGTLYATDAWQKLPDQFRQLTTLQTEQAPAPASVPAPVHIAAQTAIVQADEPDIPPIQTTEPAMEIAQNSATQEATEKNIVQTENELSGSLKMVEQSEPALSISNNPWEIIEQTGTETLAFRTLAEIWQTEVSGNDMDNCNQLLNKKLFCLQQRADIWRLQALNRPAVFQFVGSDGHKHFAVIRSINSDHATIQLDTQQWEISLTELAQRWQNQITLIWIKPPGFKKDLQQNDRGETVEWLAKQLDSIQGSMIPPRRFQTMNTLLVERLKDFQKSQGLPADGIAGPQTLIRINERIGLDAPRLNQREHS